MVSQMITLPTTRSAFYLIVLLALAGLWWQQKTKLPKKPVEIQNAFSIVLAIDTEDEKARTRLETDFVSEFRHQIEESQVADLVHILPTEKYQAVRIIKSIESLRDEARLRGSAIHNTRTKRVWSDIHSEVRGDFYLYGKLYQRERGVHVLDFRGHVDEDFSPLLKEELAGYYHAFGLEKRLIDETQEIKGFAVEAKYYYIVAKYVIAFVALYQGGLELAHRLHKDLEHEFESIDEFSNKEHLVKKLRDMLSLEHFVFARQKFSEGKVEEAEKELQLSEEYDPQNGNVYMLRAVIEYWVRLNVDTALKHVYKASTLSPTGDETWRYSEAFLLIQKQKYREALKSYEIVLSRSHENEEYIVNQVIEFNNAVLKRNPRLIESHFILGLVKGCKSTDLDEAVGHLNTFIREAGKTSRYKLLRGEAVDRRESFMNDLRLETTVKRLLTE